MDTPVMFHMLARAVIFVDGRILLAHALGADNTFLPGGHGAPGEALVRSLVRELQEELGVAARVLAYLGAVESAWEENGARHHEINHVFTVAATGLPSNASPVSREPHLEFVWSAVDELGGRNLLPLPLRESLRRWVQGDPTIWWASDLE